MVFLVSRVRIVAFHAGPVALRQEFVPASCACHLRLEIGVACIAQRIYGRRGQSNLAVLGRGVAGGTQARSIGAVREFEQEFWRVRRMRVMTARAPGISQRLFVMCGAKILARRRVALQA